MERLKKYLWLILTFSSIGVAVLLIFIGYYIKFSDLIAYGVLVGFLGFVMGFFLSLYKI